MGIDQESAGQEARWLRAIVDGIAGAAVIVVEADRRIAQQNRLARSLAPAGGSVEDWMWGDGFIDVADRKPIPSDHNPFLRAMAGETDTMTVMRVNADTGVNHVFDISGFRLSAGPDTPARTLLLVQDRTENWLLREELRERAQHETGAQLAWGLAHEMSNVFGIIQISADTALLDDRLSESSRRAVDAIRQSGERGIGLTRRLMQLTSGEEARAQLHDVVSIVEQLSAIARRVMPGHILFDCTLPSGELWVSCGRADLEQAVLGMLSHARHAVVANETGSGRIGLEVRADDGQVAIIVTHDCVDAISDNLGDLADGDPYMGTSRALFDAQAVMAPAESFARVVGGTLETVAHASVTNVRLTLPEADHASLVVGHGTIQASQTDLSGYRVLLVESDTPLMRTLSDGLRLSGAAVATAELGQEALTWLREKPQPDVVITNFSLRDGVRGQDIAAEVLEHMPETRVIFLAGTPAGYGMSATEMPGLVLTKPVKMGELAEAIAILPPISAS